MHIEIKDLVPYKTACLLTLYSPRTPNLFYPMTYCVYDSIMNSIKENTGEINIFIRTLEVQFHWFLISKLDAGEWLAHAPVIFSPKERIPNWPHRRQSGCCWENSNRRKALKWWHWPSVSCSLRLVLFSCIGVKLCLYGSVVSSGLTVHLPDYKWMSRYLKAGKQSNLKKKCRKANLLGKTSTRTILMLTSSFRDHISVINLET